MPSSNSSSASSPDPRKRADEYKNEAGDRPIPHQKPARSESEWRDAVSQAIEDAMRNGAFDNLRGKGKPLDLNKNPWTPEGSELAFDLLKNNDLVPGWIGLRGELLRDVARWRGRVSELAQRFSAEFARADDAAKVRLAERWQAQRRVLSDEVATFNRRIADINLSQPVASLEILKLRLDEELRSAGLSTELG